MLGQHVFVSFGGHVCPAIITAVYTDGSVSVTVFAANSTIPGERRRRANVSKLSELDIDGFILVGHAIWPEGT